MVIEGMSMSRKLTGSASRESDPGKVIIQSHFCMETFGSGWALPPCHAKSPRNGDVIIECILLAPDAQNATGLLKEWARVSWLGTCFACGLPRNLWMKGSCNIQSPVLIVFMI